MHDIFEQDHGDEDDSILTAPGFIKRLLLKDIDHPGTYFYISVWEAFEQLEAYRASDAARLKVQKVAAANMFASPIERVECTILEDRSARKTA